MCSVYHKSRDLSSVFNVLRVIQQALNNLDISNNTQVESVGCAGNQLTSLDVRNNPNLKYLSCGNNRIPNKDAILGINEENVRLFFDNK